MFTFPYIFFLLISTNACDDNVFNHPVTSDPPTALEIVAARMQQTPILRASFEQEKKIKALRRPLVSSGSFLFANDQGVYWHTVQPFETLFIISDVGIYQKSEGAEPFQITADKQPMIGEFNNIFGALFRGDRKELESRFKVHFTGTSEAWQLGLIPKSNTMARVISSMVICGGETLQTIRFNEAGGNQTLIAFTNIETPDALTSEERANFEF